MELYLFRDLTKASIGNNPNYLCYTKVFDCIRSHPCDLFQREISNVCAPTICIDNDSHNTESKYQQTIL